MTSQSAMKLEEIEGHAAMLNEGGNDTPSEIHRVHGNAAEGFGAAAQSGRQVMRSMSLDPVSAGRQVFDAVRRHPYLTVALLLGIGALAAGLVRR